MTKKQINIDKNRLIYILAIIAVSVNMAFARNHVMHHLTLTAFIWSVFVIKEGEIRLEIGDLLIFSGMFLFMWRYTGWIPEGLAYALMLTAVYQTGKYIAGSDKENATEYAMNTVMTLAFALFVRALLNYDYELKWRKKKQSFGFKIKIRHDLYDEVIVRTEQAFYLVLIASILICFVFILKKSIAVAVAGIILACLAVWLDVYKRGRMVICCAVAATAAVLIAYAIEKKLYKRRWVQAAGGVVLLLLAAFLVAFALNAFGLHDWYDQSIWVRDGGVFGNIRFGIMKNAFVEMLQHPFTGSNDPLFATDREGISGMAHNSWLDIGRRGGLIAFVLTVAFTVINVISLFMVWKKNSDVRRYALIAGFCGITLYNMFEPAVLNMILFWNVEVFMGGLVNGLAGRMSGKSVCVIKMAQSVPQDHRLEADRTE